MRNLRQIGLKLVSAIAITFLSACTFSSTNLPLIRFSDEEIDLGSVQWLEKTALEQGVELTPYGIYALDENQVFLFGAVHTSAGAIRSFLLRSDDGGEHWSEVMPPERGSTVTEMVFLEDGYGWALIVWSVEGSGQASLFQTTNYGEEWQKLSEIPFPGGHSATFNLQFIDRHQGQVTIDQYLLGNLCSLSTKDGGMSWVETGDCCEGDACSFERASKDTVVTQDMTRWRFEVDTVDVARDLRQIRVSRQSETDDAWIVVSSIPKHYEYIDSHPVIAQQE